MIGAVCRIKGTALDGIVVGRRTYVCDLTRYAVRYMDAAGNPQERWFTASEISFDGLRTVELRRVA